ncbi:uncharacterized protein K452DRAFT_283799 [Aplosporella prunicola CBS 121167]|uniref:Uncharacterized protein n=1 Tax=Aplosporella prunicola CBS 121167 TaxID=1176127 RepID=A0A6A6BMU0_9PEZI|nr:uncharacterized protein K452DRAFT_283799 [Aplosporella prunicola CBS 121167]KAF2145449.1 hypothetical protein K452DRAFT_283799 [Aplosporella prunicola CBS 121167]
MNTKLRADFSVQSTQTPPSMYPASASHALTSLAPRPPVSILISAPFLLSDSSSSQFFDLFLFGFSYFSLLVLLKNR